MLVAASPLATGPFAPIRSATGNLRLIRQLARREIEMKFLGSTLGMLWVLLVPLLMLGVYTFVFGSVFKARWPGAIEGSMADFAVRMFAGLVVFAFFADVVGRSPRLVIDYPNFVKKVAFPVECLPWVAAAAASVTFVASLAILIVASAWLNGMHWTVVLLPVYLLPLVLLTVGLSWALAALGVFFRDLAQIVAVVVSAMLFLTPIFYPVSAVPESFREAMLVNPLTFYAEAARNLVIDGRIPSPIEFARAVTIAIAVFLLGYAWFRKARTAFADVV